MPTKKFKSKRKRPRGWSRAGPELMVQGAAEALAEKKTRSSKKGKNEFAVVGIGASAGGLSAFKKFLGAMPDRSGMAFVLIPHLDPKHQSLMAELLAKYTPMPIYEAEDGMAVKTDHVYVIPPDKYLALREGKLRLSRPQEPRGFQTAIDFFLRSLSDDQVERAIGIVLSGTGSHGTLGLQAIKARGGMTMAQEPTTAEYDQMPRSAIAAWVVDYVLPVEKMPAALIAYFEHSCVNGTWEPSAEEEKTADELGRVLAVLRGRTKHDFRSYRKKMLLRRIQRRMSLNHLNSLSDYLQLLREKPDEVMQLFNDLLIGVTGFFREHKAYKVLEQRVLPQLIKATHPETPLRVWVPGCATGEEAYSIAMLLAERFSKLAGPGAAQVFATDINQDALEFARQGIYPESVAADISPGRLKRFFTRTDENHYQVNKQVRESIVFAPQNLISDAPFSRLDLISCRNLLIYLEPGVQAKVISLFHFALNDGGYLFLGTSETVGRRVNFFEPVSSKWRVYHRIGPTRRDLVDFPIGGREELVRLKPLVGSPAAREASFAELTHRTLLEEYAPAAVLINRRYEILYFHGPTTRYLYLPTGQPTHDLVNMTRQGLRPKVRTAVQRAIRDNEPVTITGVRFKYEGAYCSVDVTVRPIRDVRAAEGLLIVIFQDRPEPSLGPSAGAEARVDESSLVQQLENELVSTREDLQGTVEELKSSNEELMTMNEELQSANEELNTSKEELQSLNEELSTLNSQLQDKLEELEGVNNDITNFLASTDIATVFLDTEFRIKRFTPATARLLNLIDIDAGRPFSDFSRGFTDEELLRDAERVLENLTPIEKEVSASDGRWYQRRILPYRTSDNRIMGVVITFVDFSERKRMYEEVATANEKLQRSAQEFRTLADNVPALFYYVDANQCYGYVNRLHEDYFGCPQAQIAGKRVKDLLGEEAYAKQREHVESALSGKEVSYEAVLPIPRLGERLLSFSYMPDRNQEGKVRGFFALARDITDLRKVQEALEEREERLRFILSAAPSAIMTIDETGLLESFNPAAEKMFNYTAAEVIGQNVKMLMPPAYQDEHAAGLARYLKTGEARIIGIGREVVGLRKDGSTFPMELQVSEVRQRPQRLFTGIARDITARRLSQEQLLQSERLAAIGEAMTGLAHESRNALQRSQASLERLRLRMKDMPEMLEILRDVQKAQNDLHRLYEAVRGYAAPVSLVPELCRLDSIVEEAWNDLSILKEGRNARLHQDPGGLDPSCRVDRMSFRHVLRNILENSLMAKPGPVEVRVTYRGAKLDGQPAISLSVLDDGPGLTAEGTKRIFDAFYTTKIHGTGLGMALAKRVVEAYGGRIAVGSPEKGTEIVITLPWK